MLFHSEQWRTTEVAVAESRRYTFVNEIHHPAPSHSWWGVGIFLHPAVTQIPEGRPMIEALKKRLSDEVEKLRFELNVTLPDEIRKAVELGDLRENSEYKAALERQGFVRARLGQLSTRMSKLSSIDESQIATDAVGLGSRVVVEDQDTKVRESYHMIFGDAEEFDEGQVTMSSPIGRALLGKKIGEITLLRLPLMTRKMKVLELTTIHDGS